METKEKKITVYQLIEKSTVNEKIKIQISDDKRYLYISNTNSFTGIKITKSLQIQEREYTYEITRKNIIITIWKTCNHIHTHLM